MKVNNGIKDDHIYLAGRSCDIEWSDETRGVYFVAFANAGWLRVREVSTGEEFVTPASAVWRIRDLEKAN